MEKTQKQIQQFVLTFYISFYLFYVVGHTFLLVFLFGLLCWGHFRDFFISTTFMLMGLLNSLAQALRRHSWISSFRIPSGKRHIVIVVIVVVGPLPVL